MSGGARYCVGSLGAALVVYEAAQVIGAGRVAQFAQGLGFDLADALTGYVELFADFLKGCLLYTSPSPRD